MTRTELVKALQNYSMYLVGACANATSPDKAEEYRDRILAAYAAALAAKEEAEAQLGSLSAVYDGFSQGELEARHAAENIAGHWKKRAEEAEQRAANLEAQLDAVHCDDANCPHYRSDDPPAAARALARRVEGEGEGS